MPGAGRLTSCRFSAFGVSALPLAGLVPGNHWLGAVAMLLLLLAVIAGAVGGITWQEAAACTSQPAASSAAAAIPANYLADFKKADTTYNIPWTVLAAIGDIESGFGANDGPSSCWIPRGSRGTPSPGSAAR